MPALIVLVSMVAASAVGAQASDASLLVRRGEAFVAAMNAAGEAPLEAFAREHFESRLATAGAIPKVVARLVEYRAELGFLDGSNVQVVGDGRALFVYVRSARNGVWKNFQFLVVAADERRLQMVFVAQAVEPFEPPTTPIDAPETVAWLGRFLEALDREQPFSGVALVVSGERELWSAARGVAVVEPRTPMTRAARLGMASGSKLFTATAILQLVDEGKLALDAKLVDVLPDFPKREWAERVTIRQLLTHTSGAGNYWDEEYERAWGSITETSQMLPHVVRNLATTPHGEFSYSNSGYLILGLVIEKRTGKSYYDVVRERIFEPAGMRATGYPLRADREPGVAQSYKPEFEAGAVKLGSYLPVTLGGKGSAAGGASSTVDDLLAFTRALAGGKLLKPATFAEMIRPQVSQGAGDAAWGLGPEISHKGGVFSWGHGGTARGTQFELRVYPERGITSVVMSNYDTIGGYELGRALDEIVRGGKR